MTTAPALDVVTEAGLYVGMPNATYQGDPVPGGSLSNSGAKRILDCPARFAWERQHGRAPKRAFDIGSAVHSIVLEQAVDDVVVVDAEDWRTKKAQEQRDEARAAGRYPVLRKEWDVVEAMASEVRRHPIASRLLDRAAGRPEVSGFWIDPDVDEWRRVRFDFLPDEGQGRLIVPDLKTAETADPRAFARTAASYGYAMQARWYLDAVEALGLADDAAFVFVVVEKTPPHLVSVVQLDPLDVDAERPRIRRALELFAAGNSTGHWPGYADDEVALVSLPAWHRKQTDEGTWE